MGVQFLVQKAITLLTGFVLTVCVRNQTVVLDDSLTDIVYSVIVAYFVH